MAPQNFDVPVELHLLHGKALRDGKMTEELCWRLLSFVCDRYSQHKPQEGFHQIAVLSGHAGEASAARVWLGMFQALMHQPRSDGFTGPFGIGLILLETQAPSSRLNVAFAVRDVRTQGFLGPVCLYLHSSDYHCDALLELRYKLLPVSPFAFAQRETILDVIARPAPYLYPTCGIQELEWLAHVYLTRQGLRLAWENLRGISGVPGTEELKIPKKTREDLGLLVRPGTVRTLLGESVQRVEEALKSLKKLRADTFVPRPEFSERIALARKQVEDFCLNVEGHLGWLKQHVGPIGSTGTKERKEWKERARALEPYLNPTHVKEIDPDTVGFQWEVSGLLRKFPEEALPALEEALPALKVIAS